MSEEMNKEKLRKWLMTIISLFRERLKELSPEERKMTSFTLDDLSEPCQLLIVWAKKPEFQIVLILHSDSLEDNLIEIYGPIENSKLIEYIEDTVLKSRTVEVVGKEKVENYFVQALRATQAYFGPLRSPSGSLISGKIRLVDSPYVVGWTVIGNLQDLNAESVVSSIIEDIKSRVRVSTPNPPREEKIVLEGFGTYIYPPIWVGEIPKPKSFREKIIGFPFWAYSRKRIVTETYKYHSLIVMSDGYIAVGENNKQKAQEFLNEIMSILLLRGVSTSVIREVDLSEVKFTETGESYSWDPMSSRALLYEPFIGSSLLQRISISEENMKKAIKWAELLTSDDKIKTLLLLYLEAHTYFKNTEYKQSLIIGWVILEDFYIKDLWSQQISKITSDEKRLSKLGSWAVDQRLEALHISHSLTEEEFLLLTEIKDARNKVVHEGRMPQKDIVEKCLNFVSIIVQRYVGNYIGTKFHEL
jgi:hypothetical protein